MTHTSTQTGTSGQAGAQTRPVTPPPAGAPPRTGTPTQPGPPAQAGAQTPIQEQIQVWTGYTHYLLGADGLLKITLSVCKNNLDAETFATVEGVITAAHVALQGVNEQLIAGIEAMTQGKAPEYTFEPSPIPDWTDKAEDVNVFAGAWESIKGVLKTVMSATSPSSFLGAAIVGLINSGDEVVAALESAFP